MRKNKNQEQNYYLVMQIQPIRDPQPINSIYVTLL